MALPSIYGRLQKASPVGNMLAEVLEEMVLAINDLNKVVRGGNPHKADDTTNVLTKSVASTLEELIELEHDLITQYEAHRADTDVHIAADSTNTMTDTSVIADIYALANELKTDLNAHMSNDTAHTNDDDVTAQVASDDADTKAKAITLLNEIRVSYEAHRVQLTDQATGEVHGAADETNAATVAALDADATWSEIAALADDLKTQYTAHIALDATGDGVHPGGADSTNTVAAGAVGTIQTSLNTGLNEVKTDFNAHIKLASSHRNIDDSMEVNTANASSQATAITLANDLLVAYTDHISRAEEGFEALTSLKSRTATN